jgi:hypothetical protein
MRWAEHATRMGVKANVYSILVEKLEGKRKNLDHFGVDGQKLLK